MHRPVCLNCRFSDCSSSSKRCLQCDNLSDATFSIILHKCQGREQDRLSQSKEPEKLPNVMKIPLKKKATKLPTTARISKSSTTSLPVLSVSDDGVCDSFLMEDVTISNVQPLLENLLLTSMAIQPSALDLQKVLSVVLDPTTPFFSSQSVVLRLANTKPVVDCLSPSSPFFTVVDNNIIFPRLKVYLMLQL